MPGTMATLIDLAPTKAGWVAEPIYLHYQGDVGDSQQIEFGGIDTLGASVTLDAFLVGGFYTFATPVLGASYSIGAYLPYVWVDVDAKLVSTVVNKRVDDN